jgi:hypothetical protein
MSEENQVEVVGEFKCPNCGKDDSLVRKMLKEEVKAGRVDEKLELWGNVKTLEIRDSRKDLVLGQQVLVCRLYYDVCLHCGTNYLKKVTRELSKVVFRHSPNISKPKFVLPQSNEFMQNN